ncbi:ATP-binding protein, partial [Candidatus Saccharibacteria bacterium]|nr:ATP-binding protein [Candidatus Saccharibacteria bacterium]NIW79088.1 ATP-binding protein [Calditrichia bacterium]
HGEIVRKVIGVDPAVSHKKDSDETGIIVAGLDEFGGGVVLEDLSGKMSTATWAQRVVNAYHEHNCNEIVVEVNQGGDLVKDALKNIDPTVKIVDVRASNGKFARAEPVSELYELGYVSHAKSMPELEAQLTEWVPLDSDKSP